MAIKDLLANLQDETNILAMLDMHLETKQQMRKPDGCFHPSMASRCQRYIQYYLQGYSRRPFSAQTMRIFDNGTGVHERIQKYFTEMGIVIENEKKMKYTVKTPAPSITVVGSADSIVQIKKKLIVEIKSCNSFMYVKFVKEKGSLDHKVQWNLYSYGLKIPDGVFIYENKNTQEIHPVPVSFDKALFDDTIKKFKRVQKAINDSRLVVRPYKGMTAKACLKCDYKDECWSRR